LYLGTHPILSHQNLNVTGGFVGGNVVTTVFTSVLTIVVRGNVSVFKAV
jgi:hypothetical protein